MNHNSANQLDFLNDSNYLASSSNEALNDQKDLLKTEPMKIDAEAHLYPSIPEMLLIVDTETTGLDFARDQCLEVGAILFHVKSRAVIAQQSFLLPVEFNNAENINKIPASMAREFRGQGSLQLSHLLNLLGHPIA